MNLYLQFPSIIKDRQFDLLNSLADLKLGIEFVQNY